MKFRYTILYVEDVATSLDFYERAFGLERAFLHEAGDYGELSTGETRLAFSARALMRQLGKNPEPAVVERPTFEIALETDDVHASFQRAVDHGARSVMQPTDQPWGQTISYVADLDGYLVEICSPVQLPSAG
jgi:uncharacterized glyoxalase superfamily protein PhnB